MALNIEGMRKIERTCPRCRRHAYHWFTPKGTESALKNTKLHTAGCVNCGHQWPCRVLQRDVKENPMAIKCDKRSLATWCTDKDVKVVQLRSQTAGVRGTNEFKGDLVHMCSECHKSNQGGFKIVKLAVAG